MRLIVPSQARQQIAPDDRAAGRHRPRLRRLGWLSVLAACLLVGACAVQEKRDPIAYDTIPADEVPSAEDRAFGRRVMHYMLEDYPGDAGSERRDKLDEIFNHLAEASGLDPETWHVHLLDDPGIADARSVEGNYLFVWSGLFDVVENEDELAGLVACEMAHLLAGHTEPIQFTFASELLFGLADVALTMGSAMLSQGALSVTGTGITRSIFVDINDLDPVDRAYTPEQLQEMADIAALMLDASRYSPEGLLDFWRRAETLDPTPQDLERLVREIPPADRLAILEAAVLQAGGVQDDDATYADEPTQMQGPDEVTPDLGSKESAPDSLPDPTG